jgi:hypothetical protein
MGWSYGYYSKTNLIQELIADYSWEIEKTGEVAKKVCLKHCYRGNNWTGVLWSVWEVTKTLTGEKTKIDRYIGCDLLRCYAGKEWGYKGMDESVGPNYYSCPISYLDMTPPLENNGYSKKWRKEVRLRAAQYKATFKIKVGDVVELKDGYTINFVEIVSIKPLRGKTVISGQEYKIPRKAIKNNTTRQLLDIQIDFKLEFDIPEN